MYLIISILFFLMHLLMLTMMFWIDLDNTLMYELTFFSIYNMNFSMTFIADMFSCCFSSTIFLITSVVLFYSYFYMSGDLKMTRFFFLLLMFVLSMIVLIFSMNFLAIMIGWDGLGLVSFCLVIYYGGTSTLHSGLLTILMNRLGDVGLMLCLFLLIFSEEWSNFSNFLNEKSFLLFLIIASSMTKSAQVPFSSWLPAAMSAPTPISSLVHSSTLVTAGVYLLIRFNSVFLNFFSSFFFSFFTLITMMMAGLIAMVESDMKKIIAMSTLSQLGLMMFMISINQFIFCFFHMITHALFKSLLFLSGGGFISLNNGNQDLRAKGNLSTLNPNFSFLFGASSLSLIGFPFFAGFFSKDASIDYMIENNEKIFSTSFFIFSCFLTLAYSCRMYFIGMCILSQSEKTMKKNFFWSSCLELFMLFFFSLMGGNLMMLFFSFNFLSFSFFFLKMVGVWIILIGFFIFLFFPFNFLLDLMNSMFSLNIITGFFFSKNCNKLNFFSFCDQIWLELLGPSSLLKLSYINAKIFSKSVILDFFFLKFYFILIFFFMILALIFF